MALYILTGLSEEADTIQLRGGVVVMTGVAARANLDDLVGPDCEAIASWGTAGSLTKGVPVGRAVMLAKVISDDDVWHHPDYNWSTRFLAAFAVDDPKRPMLCAGYSSPNEVAITSSAKAALVARLPVATVDMGAYAVAQFAERRKVPWIAIQGVSDAYDQDVPAIMANGMNPNGSGNIGEFVGGLLANPYEFRSTVRLLDTFSQAIAALGWAYQPTQPWLKFRSE